ncbi:MAG: O-antigen ligase family protein [Ruminococcus sp.]|nr:O-antigen ligase family protein [Ruminococcus sp.]
MKTRGSLKLNPLNSNLLLFILLLPYFKPASIEYIFPALDHILDGLRVFSFAATWILFITGKKDGKKISRYFFTLCLFELSLFVSTFLNSADYRKTLISFGTVISFCMLTELSVKANAGLYFKTVFWIYFWEILADFVLLLIYPNGFAKDSYYYDIIYFLANKNGHATIFIPMMAIMCIYSAFRTRGRKFTPAAFVMLGCISAITVILWSATGVVGWAVMLLYILFIYKSRLTGILNSRLLFPVSLILQISIVFLRLQDKFQFIIEKLLRKSLTFTGRTQIWDMSLSLIKRAPVFGYGVYEGHGLTLVGNLFYYSHNIILEILLQGGCVSLILFAAMCVQTGINLYKCKNHYISGILTAGIFSIFIMMIMEAYISHIWVYGLMAISSCVPEIIEQLDRQTLSNKQPTGDLINVTNQKLT